mmetsp:Transcript_795/g.2048  ORF Transcript_795/g.2048 Transcript_795/m.2048 type:complete len:112 (+) Transcript_795:306-641(+)
MTVVKVDDQDSHLLQARETAWKRMSDGARSQFAWPHPGLERGSDDSLFSPDPVTQESAPLEDFCLLVLDPAEVDHLNLKSNERYLYKPGGPENREEKDEASASWSRLRVNP